VAGAQGLVCVWKFIWLTVSGEGALWLASSGGILKMQSDGDLNVNTNEVVAVCSTSDVKMSIKTFGGFTSKSFLFGGEGFYLTSPPDLEVYTRPPSTCAKMQRAYSKSSDK